MEIWGKLITLDEETLKEESFDVARMLIATECIQSIDEWINVAVKGRNHRVKVWEDDCDDFFNEKSVRDWVNVHLPNHGNNLTHEEKSHSQDMGNDNKAHDVLKTDANVNEPEKAYVDLNDKVDHGFKDIQQGNNGDSLGSKESNDSLNCYVEPDHVDFNKDVMGNVADRESNYRGQNGICDDDMAAEAIENMSSSLGIGKSTMGSEMVADNMGAISIENQPQTRSSNDLENQEANKKDSRAIADSDMEKCNDEGDNVNEINLDDPVRNEDIEPNKDLAEANHNPINAAVKSIQGKRNRKNIDEILGFSKVVRGSKGKRNKKCVVLRSAVATAALSASISPEGINNRNKILLNEAQAIWAVDKIMGLSYDGNEDEVISKIAEMEALNKQRANCQP